jgi:hypothetical protein
MLVERVHNLGPMAQGRWTWSLTVEMGRNPNDSARIKE